MKRSSGLFDKNGREICEGDAIVFVPKGGSQISAVVHYGKYSDAEQYEVWEHLGWFVKCNNEWYGTLPDVAENCEVTSNA